MKLNCDKCGTVYHTDRWLNDSICPFCGATNPVPANAALVESSNPGGIGHDTGYSFIDKTGSLVRVVAKVGEPNQTAIKRVRSHHNM